MKPSKVAEDRSAAALLIQVSKPDRCCREGWLGTEGGCVRQMGESFRWPYHKQGIARHLLLLLRVQSPAVADSCCSLDGYKARPGYTPRLMLLVWCALADDERRVSAAI